MLRFSGSNTTKKHPDHPDPKFSLDALLVDDFWTQRRQPMSREVTVTVRHFLQEVQQQSCFPSYFGTLRSFRLVSVSHKTLRARNTSVVA